MKKRIPSIIAIWLLADLYFFQAIKTLTACNSILWGYWLFDIFIAAGVFYTIVFRKKTQISPKFISLLMALMLLLLVPKLFALPVLLVEDITRLFRGFPPRITWVSYLALVVAAIPFVSLLFGMTKGRHFYRVCKETLRFKDLPDAFDGFTITQLSDIHAGSFSSEKGVQKGIDLVNAQNSDLILFTGDLVNNQAAEMNPWIPAFAELKATYGKYSVLGNHDYGDYIKWETKDHKYANLNRLKKQAYNLLNSEEGIERRKKRCFDIEPTFGNIKQNHGFRRFLLRGKEKVEIEWGLIAIAKNLRKKWLK